MKQLIALLLSSYVCVMVSQTNSCDTITRDLHSLSDSSINLMFQQAGKSRILFFGEFHGNKHSQVYARLLSASINHDYNCVILEQPVSYSFLYEELLNSDTYDKRVASLILSYVYNKKDFEKTIQTIYELNKKKKLKVICTDMEHSLSTALDRVYEILSLHQNTLSGDFLALYTKLTAERQKKILYEGDCATLFKEIISREQAGLYNANNLGQHFDLFKNILKAVSVNSMITGEKFSPQKRELLIADNISEGFRSGNLKAIAFFGSSHVQLLGDSVVGHFMPEPLAKILNQSDIFSNRISTVLLNYMGDASTFNYYQRYLFGYYAQCFSAMRAQNQYLYFINKEVAFTQKLNNYNFILYLN